MRWLAPLALVLFAACDPVPMDPVRAADLCEQRARAAQGPTGSVTLGYSTREGAYSGAEIGLTSDFLRGRDPLVVYEECVYQRTGQGPIRPPRLR